MTSPQKPFDLTLDMMVEAEIQLDNFIETDIRFAIEEKHKYDFVQDDLPFEEEEV